MPIIDQGHNISWCGQNIDLLGSLGIFSSLNRSIGASSKLCMMYHPKTMCLGISIFQLQCLVVYHLSKPHIFQTVQRIDYRLDMEGNFIHRSTELQKDNNHIFSILYCKFDQLGNSSIAFYLNRSIEDGSIRYMWIQSRILQTDTSKSSYLYLLLGLLGKADMILIENYRVGQQDMLHNFNH